MSNRIPPTNIPLAAKDGTISPDWYRYFVSLEKSADDAAAGEVLAGDGLSGGGAVSDGVTLEIGEGAVTDAMLRESLGTSVIGRFQNSTGAVADIRATDDNRLLGREGGLLAFRDAPTVRGLNTGLLSIGQRATAASTTYANDDCMIEADATAGAVTLTLPALDPGRLLIAKKMDASGNAVVLDGVANIDGAGTKSITTQYAAFVLVGGTTEWLIV